MKKQGATNGEKKINPNRIYLKRISEQAKEIKEVLINNLLEQGRTEKAEEIELMRVNELIVRFIYKDEENTEFKTFNDWKKEGKQVIKGAKAFLIWGHKRRTEQEQATAGEEETKKDYSFFPLSYIFSNKQIKLI